MTNAQRIPTSFATSHLPVFAGYIVTFLPAGDTAKVIEVDENFETIEAQLSTYDEMEISCITIERTTSGGPQLFRVSRQQLSITSLLGRLHGVGPPHPKL